MSSSTITAKNSVSAYTEQPAPVPKSTSDNAPVPQSLWIVLILLFILWALLAWRAFDEIADSHRDDDNSIHRLPPY